MRTISTFRVPLMVKQLTILTVLFIINVNLFAQCSCSSNLVLNPSFENGTTSWGSSGGNLNAGTGAVVCGNNSGDFEITNNSNNWVSQTIGTDLPVGTVINASVYAGTHNNSFWHEVTIGFYDANWNWIGSSYVSVDKVLSAAPAGPKLYSWNGVVPPGCKYTTVGFNGNGSWIKTDVWCVTTSLANTVSFGNQVFIDVNGNGLNDGSDWGYDGVTVRLYADANDDGVADGASLATKTTSGGGFYNFTGLTPGKYFVQIEDVPYWMNKAVPNGGDPDNDIDNDNSGLTQNTTTGIIKGGTITLSLGAEPQTNHNPTYDFGLFKTNGLGDQVFLDADADGIQDAGEAGIAGVTVNLRNTSGSLLATTTTDATGYYYFYDPAQYGTYNYNIEFITPAGYGRSPSNQGADDSKDSDPVNGVIVNASVPDRIWNYTFDAGFYPLMAVGDRVFYDVNNNGIQAASGEPGIAGVPVYLYRDANNDNVADGASIANTSTNATGNYLFSNLVPGNYIVGILPPANYYSSTTNGGDPDSNVNMDNNSMTSDTTTREIRGYTITLSPFAEFDGTSNNTNTNVTYDFGLTTGTIKLGDYVWDDINKNGEQDGGEPGIPNQWVVLKSADKNGEITKKKTDANGYYLFENMAPGNYFMKFPGLPNMVPTIERTGNNSRNSKANSAGWAPVLLLPGIDDMDIDAGYHRGWTLAVQEITITTVLNGNKVDINWQTINETNSAYFDVERSYNGTAFVKVATVNSLVPNGGNASYRSTDNSFQNTATVLYYRIKMVDKDGKITYSKIVPVKIDKQDEITVWPNPFISTISFSYKTNKATELHVRLFDISGKTIKDQQFKISAGTSSLIINNLNNIPAGNYFLELIDVNSGDKQVKRIIK